jgi:quinol monooxygenase YgiN
MSAGISWIFDVEVNPGALDDVKALIKEMVEATREAEPETLSYLWFVTGDGRFVHVYERYPDPDAALFHIGRFTKHFAARLLALSTVSGFTIYGQPSDALREAVASLDPTYLAPIDGFTR